MNREIKFRGKNGNDWVFGSLVYSHKENQYCITEHNENELIFEVEAETVGQFTGLHDKNGKEIYEGDVFEKTSHPRIYYRAEKGEDYEIHNGVYQRFVVIWNEKIACFDSELIYVNPAGVLIGSCLIPRHEIAVGNRCGLECYFNEHRKQEIIGNIHDNPELLISKN